MNLNMAVFDLIWVKMICKAALPGVLALLTHPTVSAVPAQDAEPGASEASLAQRAADMQVPSEIDESLSDFFVRASNLVGSGNSRSGMYLFHIDVLRILSEYATELGPDSLAAWQLRLQALGLMDPDDEGVDEAKMNAFGEIARLDPGNEVIRFQRLLFLIDQKQTEEERVAAFEVLLDPANTKVIGEKVSARLSLKLAQLLYRTGDIEGYLKYLALAIELDPFFPAATSEFAGYLDSSDPEARVEMLIAALIANPLEAIFAAQIGAQALDVGDFSSAARMIGLARSSAQARGMELGEYALLQARSLWGAGRLDEAERVLSQYELWEKKAFQREAKLADSFLTDAELQDLKPPVDPSMVLLQSVMLMNSGDKQKHRTFVDEALMSFVLSLDLEELDPTEDAQVIATKAQDLLEMIAFAAWQGEDSEVMQSLIDELSGLVELSDVQRSLYDAWKEFAKGRYESALSMLDSISEDDRDILGLLCVSQANERLGNIRQAARTWLKIVDRSPGSLIGIWARQRLEATLNTTVPMSDQARRLSQLISEIPAAVDRILRNRERAYSMLVEPVVDPVGPFQSMMYRLTIRNRSGIPLAIGPNGSLKGQVAFLPSYTVVGMQGDMPTENFVESISRKFSIEPSESLELEINIATSDLGQRLSSSTLQGSNVSLRVISNFDYNAQALKVVPGLFSNVATSSLLRVNGVPNGKPWRRDALASARRLDGFQSVKDLALLLMAATESLVKEDDDSYSPEMEAFREEVLDLYTRVWSSAPEPVRAWLASVVPGGLDAYPELSTINTLVVLDDAPLVVAVTLINKVWGIAEEREVRSYIASTIGNAPGGPTSSPVDFPASSHPRNMNIELIPVPVNRSRRDPSW